MENSVVERLAGTSMGEECNFNFSDRISFIDNNNLNRSVSTTSASAIESSNIGFKLLKKHGWKEGTGLGATGQGRLEPVEALVKKNKRGLGAETVKKKETFKPSQQRETSASDHAKPRKETKKAKALSKRTRKRLEAEKMMQEKEFERAFFREFWPENV